MGDIKKMYPYTTPGNYKKKNCLNNKLDLFQPTCGLICKIINVLEITS